jgi:hypothetical protein
VLVREIRGKEFGINIHRFTDFAWFYRIESLLPAVFAASVPRLIREAE